MPLKWKIRLTILFIVAFVAVGSALINAIAIETEGLPWDTNVKEAYFFNGNYQMSFLFENGTMNSVQTLKVQGTVLDATHTNVSITIDGILQGFFITSPQGFVYNGSTLTSNYSIWWIYVPNPMLSLGQGLRVGTTYNVIDPTGFLGISNQTYILVVDSKAVYWPTDARLWMILGAQASFQYTLYNKSNLMRISSGWSDLTCGVPFLFDGAQQDHVQLTLYDTNFPISRNRINMFPWVFILGAIAIVSIYLIMRKEWKSRLFSRLNVEPETRNEIIMLVTAGIFAIALEFVDIWWYLPLGLSGNLLLHLGFLGGLALIIWKKKYGFKWLVPGLLEVAFVGVISFATGEPYVPALTAFMGSFISWLCLLYISGYEKSNEAQKPIEKVLSAFV